MGAGVEGGGVDGAVREVAARLRAARGARRPIPPVRTALPTKDVDVAYAVQALNFEAALASGRRRIGRKIGLTSKAVQAQLGVDQPDFGSLLDDMRVEPGARLSASGLIAPRIEGEIAFRLGADVTHPFASHDDLVRAVDAVSAALEIVDSAIAGWDIDIVDTVADNASCGLFVLGAPAAPPETADLADRAMRLTCDRGIVSEGAGSATLGHPLNALAWLADTAIARGDPLRKGEWVLAGALGPMQPMTPGAYRLEIDGLEPLGIEVAP